MRKTIAVGLPVLLAWSCSPSGPSMPPIEMTALSPSSGATVAIVGCATTGNLAARCTRSLRISFAVRPDNDMKDAYLSAEIMSGGARCGLAQSPTYNIFEERGNLMEVGTIYVESPPETPCTRPFRSDQVVVALHDSADIRRSSATFPLTYTFGTPTPPPTPRPTAATPAPSTPAPTPRSCCKICTAGKACGDSCIAESNNCNVGQGCACNGLTGLFGAWE